MKSQGSLPCIQKSLIRPYPQTIYSDQALHIILRQKTLRYYYPPIYAYLYQIVSSLLTFRPRFCMNLSSQFVLLFHLIIFLMAVTNLGEESKL